MDCLCAAFPSPEFFVSENAAREAVLDGGQFNVIHSGLGKQNRLYDCTKRFGENAVDCRVRRPILPDRVGLVAAQEDVIIAKLWYYNEGGSEKHLRDTAAMLQTSGELIDMHYIGRWARRTSGPQTIGGQSWIVRTVDPE